MPAKLSPQEFVAKWRSATLKERSAAQEHFIDLCRLIGHLTPAEADPTGESFSFEAGAALTPSPRGRGGQEGGRGPSTGSGRGWADVWKKGYFAWEYKGKHADLDKAYQQLLQYREALQNPPLLIVSDIDSLVIHTNFTNTIKQVTRLSLDDLLTAAGLAALRNIFYSPDAFRAPQTTEQVTEQAAKEFARLAQLLRQYGDDPQQIAHFLIRLLFCLFAEDVALLPSRLFSQLVSRARRSPADFSAQLGQLFGAMAMGQNKH
jgi:hypothetical protein